MSISNRAKAREKDQILSEEMKLGIQVEVQREIKLLRFAIHEELLKMQLQYQNNVGGCLFFLTDN